MQTMFVLVARKGEQAWWLCVVVLDVGVPEFKRIPERRTDAQPRDSARD